MVDQRQSLRKGILLKILERPIDGFDSEEPGDNCSNTGNDGACNKHPLWVDLNQLGNAVLKVRILNDLQVPTSAPNLPAAADMP